MSPPATKNGWSTEYVGVPADNPFSTAPFSSIPSGASADLETFAFGGPDGCSPCFAGRLHRDPGPPSRRQPRPGHGRGPGFEPGPAANPDGYIAKDLSANGEHFIFGSTSLFAEGGNDATGDVSIYDHNLKTGETHVVSNTARPKTSPSRCPACRAPAAATPRATATGSPSSTSQATAPTSSSARRSQPTPTATSTGTSTWTSTTRSARSTSPPEPPTGVLYDGMTADGSKVFFTTKDKLSGRTITTPAPTSIEAKPRRLHRHPDPDLHRQRRQRATPTPAIRSRTQTANTGTRSARPKTATRSRSAAAAESPRPTARSTSSPRAARRRRNGTARPAQPLPRRPRLRRRASSPPSSPTTRVVLDSLKAAEQNHTADFQVTPSGRFAAFATDDTA